MPPPDETPGPPKLEVSALHAKPPSKKASATEPPAKPKSDLPPTLKHSQRKRRQLRNQVLEQEVSRLWWDKYTRLAACAAIFTVVIGWLWAVRQLLVLPVAERPPDSVLIAALGTTTVNVLGLLYIVARYLFPQQARATSRDATLTAE